MTDYRGITNPNLELVNREFLSSEVRVKLEQAIKANLRGLGYGGLRERNHPWLRG